MLIYIDGQKLPINPRTTRDTVTTLKTIAKNQSWGLFFDSAKESIYINTKSSEPPNPASKGRSDDEPESARLAGITICLDPGHGGSDPGAIGPSGTMEKDNTLAITFLLRDLLENHGANVFLTREADEDVAYENSSSSEELRARVNVANESKADIFISIHNDAFTNPSAAGTTTYHYGDKESQSLAVCIQQSVVASLGTNDRGQRFASFYVLRYTDMPAVLVEVAFISNPEEEILLASTDGRRNAALSIFEGILKYYKV